MLVTFTSKAYAKITMFGDVALHMLKLMGHSATVLGAILAEDIPAALQRLKAAVEADRLSPQPKAPNQGKDDEVDVSLMHRALPLIELLKASIKAECNVMWDSGTRGI